MPCWVTRPYHRSHNGAAKSQKLPPERWGRGSGGRREGRAAEGGGRGQAAGKRQDGQRAEWGEGTRQALGRASDGQGRDGQEMGVAGMVGMDGAVGSVWSEGWPVVGMGGAKKGRGVANDGGLHLFPVPEPPPLGEEGDRHGTQVWRQGSVGTAGAQGQAPGSA